MATPTTTAGDRALDTQGMIEAHASLPEQVRRAAEAANQVDGLPRREDIDNVVVLGMGGSGVAGDVLVAAAGAFLPVPVVVSKAYELPHFVDESSLVFAISFSGDTEETVETATEAAVEGARLVVITSGGELGRLAERWGAPMVRVPASIPQPRAALGAMAIPPLVVLERVGLFPGAGEWIELAVTQLERRRRELLADAGPAAELARLIGRTVPLIHGGGCLGGTAAQRWKTQINENAKSPAFWNVQPELCHNEICGWGQHGDLTRQAITLVNLRHDYEHPQVMRRFELVTAMVEEVLAGTHEVRAGGEGQLAQVLDLILFGDLVSCHLALQEGIDPGPVAALTELKGALRAG
ncbi:MAG: bifunctional phosphoglucose/phosphomannose isomerase [Acidimicrobiales bacterium]